MSKERPTVSLRVDKQVYRVLSSHVRKEKTTFQAILEPVVVDVCNKIQVGTCLHTANNTIPPDLMVLLVSLKKALEKILENNEEG